MKDIQEVFDEIQKLKKEKRDISREYKYLLDNNGSYQEITGEIKKLRDQKKKIEEANKSPRLDDLKSEIDALNEMASDIAISQLMNGQSIHIKDEYEIEYEPVYKVTFKKIK
ncbi:MAG: hypothetical protein UR60_C0044G0011 [Candidatus Moranbacteria bacterium GW2011_GWF2_34_56]|nr:MAG: hypothetical protein UR51_C0022G0010 [Candidatus Moranbacteria bacterium GW2011_GWF1_34_10]KKP63437.1 MAG: hypothetical protein UR60_C0044G0011 [Candidatus Moranbacteria bacterium GW2011_GWF2_34_56]HBI17209.1 hypothetical protein [Candidatus Moranbacteria bacterium]